MKCHPNQRRQNYCGSKVKTIVFNDSSKTPRAYSCMRSIHACPLKTTGDSPFARCVYMGNCDLILIFSCCLNAVLVVKSQQGLYDVTDKWHKYMPFELWCWRRLLRVPWTARRSNQSILNKSSLNIHWKNWCWSSSSNYLLIWWEELTHWKRPWY